MNCLFCQIIHGQVEATIVYEDEWLIAIKDIAPQAPTHLLLIPKKHIATINDATQADALLLGNLIMAAQKLAAANQISQFGYRLVFNVNAGGGQAVYHIHLHLLGGKQMTWPPG